MPVCDAGYDCRRPRVVVGARRLPGHLDPEGIAHGFAGYGFWVQYHPECCPGHVDGSVCEYDHPDGWMPEGGGEVLKQLCDEAAAGRRAREAAQLERHRRDALAEGRRKMLARRTGRTGRELFLGDGRSLR